MICNPVVLLEFVSKYLDYFKINWAAQERFCYNMPYLYFRVLLKLMESRESALAGRPQDSLSHANAWKHGMNSMVEQAFGLKASFRPTQLELLSDYIILKIKMQPTSETAYLRYLWYCTGRER